MVLLEYQHGSHLDRIDTATPYVHTQVLGLRRQLIALGAIKSNG